MTTLELFGEYLYKIRNLKKHLILFVFLLFSIAIQAQKIEFKILDNNTSKPIKNATVFNRLDSLVANTNANGIFFIEEEALPLLVTINALNYSDLQTKLSKDDKSTVLYLSSAAEMLVEVLVRSSLIETKTLNFPGAVDVISSKDLERVDASNLVQIFNTIPGVYANQGALNTNKLNIRGIGSRSQYSTNRIQAYFEGIPLTTGEGELTLDDFDAETISSIEIIKGPASSLYGAGLGGAINLYGKSIGEEYSNLKVESFFGSYNLNKNTISAGIGSKRSSIFVNFSDLRSDGYRDNGKYRRSSGFLNYGLKITENDHLNILANFTQLKAFIPSSINYSDYLNNPTSAAFTWKASQGYESYDRGMFGVSYEHSFSQNLKNTSSVFVNFRDAYEPRPFDILEENRIATGFRTKFNFESEIFKLPSELSFGISYYKEWYEISNYQNLYRDFENLVSIQGVVINKNDQDRQYANFFAQLNLELSDRWNLESGFNLNTTNYKLTDLFEGDTVDQTGDYSFKTIFSPRVAVLFELNNNKNLYASISHGFSTPTVAETLTPDGAINTDLQPETGVNYEIGFKGNWLKNRLYTQISFYSIQVEDLLVAERVAEDRYVGANVGKTDHNGIEFQANYRIDLKRDITINPYLNGSLNFFRFDKFIDSDIEYSGNRLPGVPKSTVNLGVDLLYKKSLSIHANYLAVGEIPLNDANSDYSDNYQLLNFKASYNFMIANNWNISFNAGVNNILDEKYASSILPNAVGFGGQAPRSYYPGNPRNYFGGLGFKYQF